MRRRRSAYRWSASESNQFGSSLKPIWSFFPFCICFVMLTDVHAAAVQYCRPNNNKLCGRRGCGRHGIPPPACNNPTAQTFIVGHGIVDSACTNHLQSFKFTFSIIRPGEVDRFTFWPRTWCTLLHVRWTTFPPILVFLGRFVPDLSANTCQTRYVTLRP